MNSLAHAVHAMVVGRKPIEAAARDLTLQEQAVLRDMQAALSRLPADLARKLVEVGPQDEWWRTEPSPAA